MIEFRCTVALNVRFSEGCSGLQTIYVCTSYCDRISWEIYAVNVYVLCRNWRIHFGLEYACKAAGLDYWLQERFFLRRLPFLPPRAIRQTNMYAEDNCELCHKSFVETLDLLSTSTGIWHVLAYDTKYVCWSVNPLNYRLTRRGRKKTALVSKLKVVRTAITNFVIQLMDI